MDLFFFFNATRPVQSESAFVLSLHTPGIGK